MTRSVQVICNFMYLIIHITNTDTISSFFSLVQRSFNFHPAHLGQLPRILYLGQNDT